MKLLQINTSITRDWKTSISALLQTLRRVKIAVEDTFSWGDFDPQTNWGTTYTGYSIRRARYLKIGKIMWLSTTIQATLTAGTLLVKITLPSKIAGEQQWGAIMTNNGGAINPGIWSASASADNTMNLYLAAGAIFAATFTVISLNTFVEVE